MTTALCEKDSQLAALEKRNDALEARLAALEKLAGSLAKDREGVVAQCEGKVKAR